MGVRRCADGCRPAVHHGGGVTGVLVHVLPHQVPEVDEQLGGLRHAMVWPGGEMEVPHGARLGRPHLHRNTEGHKPQTHRHTHFCWELFILDIVNFVFIIIYNYCTYTCIIIYYITVISLLYV